MSSEGYKSVTGLPPPSCCGFSHGRGHPHTSRPRPSACETPVVVPAGAGADTSNCKGPGEGERGGHLVGIELAGVGALDGEEAVEGAEVQGLVAVAHSTVVRVQELGAGAPGPGTKGMGGRDPPPKRPRGTKPRKTSNWKSVEKREGVNKIHHTPTQTR